MYKYNALEIGFFFRVIIFFFFPRFVVDRSKLVGRGRPTTRNYGCPSKTVSGRRPLHRIDACDVGDTRTNLRAENHVTVCIVRGGQRLDRVGLV